MFAMFMSSGLSIERVKKLARLGFKIIHFSLAIAFALFLIWRANDYCENLGTGMLAPMMCMVLAVSVLLTVLAFLVMDGKAV